MDTRYDVLFSTPVPESLATLHAVCTPYVPCHTLAEHSGAWHGVTEHAYTLTVYGTVMDEATIISLAKHLKETYEQEAVLVVKTPVATLLV